MEAVHRSFRNCEFEIVVTRNRLKDQYFYSSGTIMQESMYPR